MENQLLAFLNFLSNERNYSDNTIAAYRNDLSQFLDWLNVQYVEVQHWADVSYLMVSEYSDILKRKSYTASSVARKVAAIKSFFIHTKLL